MNKLKIKITNDNRTVIFDINGKTLMCYDVRICKFTGQATLVTSAKTPTIGDDYYNDMITAIKVEEIEVDLIHQEIHEYQYSHTVILHERFKYNSLANN